MVLPISSFSRASSASLSSTLNVVVLPSRNLTANSIVDLVKKASSQNQSVSDSSCPTPTIRILTMAVLEARLEQSVTLKKVKYHVRDRMQ